MRNDDLCIFRIPGALNMGYQNGVQKFRVFLGFSGMFTREGFPKIPWTFLWFFLGFPKIRLKKASEEEPLAERKKEDPNVWFYRPQPGVETAKTTKNNEK